MEAVNPIIRKAVKQDCGQIFELAKELAACLNAPLEVSAEDLERDGFDTDIPFFHSLVAEDSNERTTDGRRKLIGYIIYYYAYEICGGKGAKLFLENIYVTKEHRRKGVGLAMFDSLIEIALKQGCQSIDGNVARSNLLEQEIYRYKGGVDITETEPYNTLLTYRLTREKMIALHEATLNRRQISHRCTIQ